MNSKIVNEALWKDVLHSWEDQEGAAEHASVAQTEEGVVTEVEERLREICIGNTDDFLSDSEALLKTISCVDHVLAFIEAKKAERCELSTKLEELQVQLVQNMESMQDHVDLITELADGDESEQRSLCLPQDVWLPFLGGEACDPFSKQMAECLWGQTSLQEIQSSTKAATQMESLLRRILAQHQRELEVAGLRENVVKAERDMLQKLADKQQYDGGRGMYNSIE